MRVLYLCLLAKTNRLEPCHLVCASKMLKDEMILGGLGTWLRWLGGKNPCSASIRTCVQSPAPIQMASPGCICIADRVTLWVRDDCLLIDKPI